MPTVTMHEPRPIIGICSRPISGEGKGYEEKTCIATDYATRVAAAGGIPIALPLGDYAAGMADELMHAIDGLLLTGGGDVSPDDFGGHPYGRGCSAPIDGECHNRDSFEWAAARSAWALDLPTLGICRGIQVLNIVHGGTIVRDVSELGNTNELAHVQPEPFDVPSHHVRIDTTSKLGRILGLDEFEVNSMHHQAICDVAPNARVVAWAPDGTLEGIEFDEKTFCIGVQWHPEIMGSMPQLFHAFVEAAIARRDGTQAA